MGLGIFFLAGGAGLVSRQAFVNTCYASSPFSSERFPAMAVEQKTLLDDFHRRGILGDAAHARAVAALAEPDPPAGADPSSGGK